MSHTCTLGIMHSILSTHTAAYTLYSKLISALSYKLPVVSGRLSVGLMRKKA